MIHNLSIELAIETVYELMMNETISEETGDRFLNRYYELQEQGEVYIQFYSELII